MHSSTPGAAARMVLRSFSSTARLSAGSRAKKLSWVATLSLTFMRCSPSDLTSTVWRRGRPTACGSAAADPSETRHA